MRQKKINPVNALLLAISAIMLTFAQAPFDLAPLAWLALVPFLLVSAYNPNQKISYLYLFTYIISTIYWLANLYWLFPITIIGWLAFCIYMGLYWPLCMKTIRFCNTKKIPLFISVPIIIVGAEFFQGLIWRGFAWRYLGHSQYENIAIIQIADIFGAAGISFLIAMTNGQAASLIISWLNKKLITGKNLITTTLVIAAIIATITYGKYRINQTPNFTTPGPKVAAIQTNVPIELGRETQTKEQIFINLLTDSRTAAKAGAQLAIWPETMVEAVLDKRYLEKIPNDHLSNIFHAALKRHAAEGLYLLIGAFGGKPYINDGYVEMQTQYNSAFLYTPEPAQETNYYSKIHLVPFGEYIPFQNLKPVSKILEIFASHGFEYSIDHGKEYTIFKMNTPTATYKFATMICFEDTVPYIARKMTLDSTGKKQIDFLTNISNDGWFTTLKPDNTTRPSTELPQHTAICAFRAVENRLPIIRSVNTGISCTIDSLGRINNDYIAGTLPKNWKSRSATPGWLLDELILDKRTTFFTQHGRFLDNICGLLFTITAIWSIYTLEGSKFSRRKL